MSIGPATRARIEGAHRFSAFYRRYLANHLPMALVALDAMGATDADMSRFQARYEAQLEPLLVAREAIPADDENRKLGVVQAFPSWFEFFAHRIELAGAAHVLSQWVDRLAAGIGSGAFHGAIRTAYAWESGSEREIAHALAYWASAYEEASPPAGALGGGPHLDGAPFEKTASPAQMLSSIANDPRYAGRRFAGANIAERTRHAQSQPEFAALVGRVDPEQLNLDSIAAALIGAYAASGNFAILHGVTGGHAFRLLTPHFRDQRAALAHFWNAIVAAYLGCGSPPVEGWRLEGRDSLDWREIHRRAVACDDEHDVKLTYSCWCEALHYRNDLYRRVASAVVCAAQREAMPC